MLSLAILLLIVMDPFGNLVIINTLLGEMPAHRRQQIILRESLIATSILLGAVFVGGAVLTALGLEGFSLSISGGIVLFLIALGMLFPSRKVIDEVSVEPPLIVPIAMPLMAGPSSISMTILFSQEHPNATVCLAVLIASCAASALLYASPWMFAFLGRRGSLALERLMGMLLIMISVQMVLDGIDAYLTKIG